MTIAKINLQGSPMPQGTTAKKTSQTVTSFRDMVKEMTEPQTVMAKMQENAEKMQEQKEKELQMKAKTVTRHLMPDGTIEFVEMTGNKVTSRYRQKRPMITVADPNNPPEKDAKGNTIPGTGKTIQKPRENVFDLL